MQTSSFFIFKDETIQVYQIDFETNIFVADINHDTQDQLVVTDPSAFARYLYQQKPHSSFVTHLQKIKTIALYFPKFVHGQSYSVAHLIRQRFNYQGTLLAYGDIALDQTPLLYKLKFQGFHVTSDQEFGNWKALVQARLALFPELYYSM